MPVLPNYEARRNISSNLAQPLRNEAVQNMQPMNNLIDTGAKVAQAWSDANDVMQYNEAAASFNTKIADIESRASLDPDFKNSEKYNQEIDKAVADSVKGIQNQQVAGGVATKFGGEAQIAKIRIDTQFKKKGIAVNKVNLESNLDTLFQQRAYATGEALTKIDTEISNLVTSNVDAGLVGTLDAQEMMYKSIKKSYTNLVYDDPQRGLQALSADESLTKEDKRKLQDEAKAVIKKDKEFKEFQQKENQVQATIGLSEALKGGTLTPTMVSDMQQSGIIDAETAAIFSAAAIDKKYPIPDNTALAKPEYFLNLLQNTQSDNPKIDKILRDATEAYNKGEIGGNQYMYFIQEAKTTFDNRRNGVNTKTKEQEGIYAAVKGLVDWAPPVAMGNMVTKFFDRYKQGDDANAVAKQTMNEQRVIDKPDISTIPKEGIIMVDANGVRARVFPDGHVEEE